MFFQTVQNSPSLGAMAASGGGGDGGNNVNDPDQKSTSSVLGHILKECGVLDKENLDLVRDGTLPCN